MPRKLRTSQNIAIFGAASDRISKKKKKQAYYIGTLIGKGGHRLIFGAGSTGIMGAVWEGYNSTNPSNKAFGSTTGYIKALENSLTETEINLFTANCLNDRENIYNLADIIIVLPGGSGTATELERYRTYKHLALACKLRDMPVRTWNGDLYLLKAGTWKETINKWEAEYKQGMAPHWGHFVRLLDMKELEEWF